jgi:hypothetical protein
MGAQRHPPLPRVQDDDQHPVGCPLLYPLAVRKLADFSPGDTPDAAPGRICA